MNTTLKNDQIPLLSLPTCRGVERVNIQDIIRIQSHSNYSKIYFCNGRTLVMAKVLHWFEKQLTHHHFIRSHRSHLVNENHIMSYGKKLRDKMILSNGEGITVARRRKAALFIILDV